MVNKGQVEEIQPVLFIQASNFRILSHKFTINKKELL